MSTPKVCLDTFNRYRNFFCMKLYRSRSHDHTWKEIQVLNCQLTELADGLPLKWSHPLERETVL